MIAGSARVSFRYWMSPCVTVLVGLLVLGTTACSDSGNGPVGQPPAQDNRFQKNALASPTGGYVDSVFINALGDRIYFLHSVYSVNDFMNGTSNDPPVAFLPGHTEFPGLEWNTDLYYVEWNGSSWSAPKNLGSSFNGSAVNSPGNECCVWLNETETEIIFYRDTFDLAALGPRGNFRVSRATRDDLWGTPVLLPGDYGSGNQSASIYRHDIHKTASGDLYLWENDKSLANKGRLLFGKWNGVAWDVPAAIAGSDSQNDESQVWVSRDELTMLFNRRDSTGNTSLMRMTRASMTSAWGALETVSVLNVADSNGQAIWGEPTLATTEDYMLFIRFDTGQSPWKAQIMYSGGNPAQGFGTPIPLN